MGNEFFRQPTKRLEREFRALGGRCVSRGNAGINYQFPDGGVRLIPAGVTPGAARSILMEVQARYGGQRHRSRTDPLRSAEKRDGAPVVTAERLSMSRHASQRFELMQSQAGLHQTEVADALRFPEQVLWSPLHESWLWVRGRVIVVIAADDNGATLIRTIMWATEDLWEQNPRPEEARA